MFEFIFILFLKILVVTNACSIGINNIPIEHTAFFYAEANMNITPEIPTSTPTFTPQVEPTTTPTPFIEMPIPSPTAEPVIDIDEKSSVNEDLISTPQEEEVDMNYIEELTNLGYIKDEYDDNNINIRNGVLRFQADSNLTADGIYGPRSTAALTKRIKDRDFQYKDTISNPPSENYWIFINKTRRILTLYEGTKVVKKYPIAVGNPPSLTPEGHLKIVLKVVDPAWGGGGYANPVAGGVPENPLGHRWMGLDLGGGGEYGIHGNNAPYSIGTNASHGCIRMINSDVENLYDIVPEDTPVWIGNDDSLENNGITQPVY